MSAYRTFANFGRHPMQLFLLPRFETDDDLAVFRRRLVMFRPDPPAFTALLRETYNLT